MLPVAGMALYPFLKGIGGKASIIATQQQTSTFLCGGLS
jgi:hypothetical protein